MCVVWDLEWIFSSNLIKIIVTTYDDYAPLSLIYNPKAAVGQTRNIPSWFSSNAPKQLWHNQLLVCCI